MTKARETTIKVEDLRQGDTIKWDGIRHNVTAAIPEPDGTYFLRLQVPGSPVLTFTHADPSFTFTRISQ